MFIIYKRKFAPVYIYMYVDFNLCMYGAKPLLLILSTLFWQWTQFVAHKGLLIEHTVDIGLKYFCLFFEDGPLFCIKGSLLRLIVNYTFLQKFFCDKYNACSPRDIIPSFP